MSGDARVAEIEESVHAVAAYLAARPAYCMKPSRYLNDVEYLLARLVAAERERDALAEALQTWPQDGSVHEPGCLADDSDTPDDLCDCFTSIARAALASTGAEAAG